MPENTRGLLPIKHSKADLELAIKFQTEIIESTDEEIQIMATAEALGTVVPEEVRKRFRCRRGIDILSLEVLRQQEEIEQLKLKIKELEGK